MYVLYFSSLTRIIYFLQLRILHILKPGNKLGVVDDIPNPMHAVKNHRCVYTAIVRTNTRGSKRNKEKIEDEDVENMN